MRAGFLLTVAATVCSGCVMPEQGLSAPGGDPSNSKALKTAFSIHYSRTVEDRLLLLPVVLAPDAKSDFAEKMTSMSSSSWSSSGSGSESNSSSWGYERAVNLEVIELAENTHHRVFDHPVVLGSWLLSFKNGQVENGLSFKDLLILDARTVDANGDKEINDQDPAWIFVYDLRKHELRRVSPEGYTVIRRQWTGDSLLMMVRHGDREPALSVYVFQPSTGQGHFAARDVAP